MGKTIWRDVHLEADTLRLVLIRSEDIVYVYSEEDVSP